VPYELALSVVRISLPAVRHKSGKGQPGFVRLPDDCSYSNECSCWDARGSRAFLSSRIRCGLAREGSGAAASSEFSAPRNTLPFAGSTLFALMEHTALTSGHTNSYSSRAWLSFLEVFVQFHAPYCDGENKSYVFPAVIAGREPFAINASDLVFFGMFGVM
jgi:hypothetical protein